MPEAALGTLCPAGFYKDISLTCVPCPPGTYSTAINSTACTAVPLQATVNSTATGFDCISGYTTTPENPYCCPIQQPNDVYTVYTGPNCTPTYPTPDALNAQNILTGIAAVTPSPTKPCPVGMDSITCAEIQSGETAFITPIVYQTNPPVTVSVTAFPTPLQDALNDCNGNSTCKYVGYDFSSDVPNEAASTPYVIDTSYSTQMDSSVFVKRDASFQTPVVFLTPPGFQTLSSFQPYTNPGTVTTATLDQCATNCRAQSSCTGFNHNSETKACQLITGSLSVDISGSSTSVGYMKDITAPPSSVLWPGNVPTGTDLGSSGNMCQTPAACNADLTKLFSPLGTNPPFSFTTSEIASCAFCPVRTFDVATTWVGLELENVYTITKKSIDVLTYGTGPTAQHNINITTGFWTCTPYVDGGSGPMTCAYIQSSTSPNTGSIYFMRTIPGGGNPNTTRPTVYMIKGLSSTGGFQDFGDLNTTITSTTAMKDYTAATDTAARFVPCPYVTNGFFITGSSGLYMTSNIHIQGGGGISPPMFSNAYNQCVFILTPSTLPNFFSQITDTNNPLIWKSTNGSYVRLYPTPRGGTPFYQRYYDKWVIQMYANPGHVPPDDSYTRNIWTYYYDFIPVFYAFSSNGNANIPSVSTSWSTAGTYPLDTWIQIDDAFLTQFFTAPTTPYLIDPTPLATNGQPQFYSMAIAPYQPNTQNWANSNKQGCGTGCSAYIEYMCTASGGGNCDCGAGACVSGPVCSGTHVVCAPNEPDISQIFPPPILGLIPVRTYMIRGTSGSSEGRDYDTSYIRIVVLYTYDTTFPGSVNITSSLVTSTFVPSVIQRIQNDGNYTPICTSPLAWSVALKACACPETSGSLQQYFNGTSCLPCDTCLTNGYYKSASCTATTNAVCSQCPQNFYCPADGTKQPCTTCPTTQTNSTLVASSTCTSSSDATCVYACNYGFYQYGTSMSSTTSGTSIPVCLQCSQCYSIPGATVTQSGCSGSNDRTCTYTCSSPGYYQSGTTGTSTMCSPCQTCSSAPANATLTQGGSCSSVTCTYACNSGYYASSGSGSSTVCTTCPEPTGLQWVSSTCTPTARTGFTTLSCPTSQYARNWSAGSSSTLGSAGTCSACGVPSPQTTTFPLQYVSALCSVTTNTTITSLTCPNSYQYAYGWSAGSPSSLGSAGTCISCGVPTVGTNYVSKTCTASTNTTLTQITACASTSQYLKGYSAGTYSTLGQLGTCTACSNPGQTQYVTQACENISDTTLATIPSCPYGQTLHGTVQGSYSQVGSPGVCCSPLTSPGTIWSDSTTCNTLTCPSGTTPDSTKSICVPSSCVPDQSAFSVTVSSYVTNTQGAQAVCCTNQGYQMTMNGSTLQGTCGYAGECPPGQYSSQGTCTACATNTFTTTYGASSCSSCPSGSTTQGKTGQTTCVCSAGYSQTGSGTTLSCTPCTSGSTYSNTPGTSQCTPCASPDSSTWQYTVTACTPSTGTVIATSAAGNCTTGVTYNKGYIAGTSSVTGAAGTCTACTPCTAAGTNATVTNGGCSGTNDRTCSYACSTGYAKTSTDTNGCSQCATGYGNTTAGGLTCTVCTPGTNYTSAPGTGACTSCPTPTNTYDYVTAACTATTPTAITSRATSPCTTGYLSGFIQGSSSQVGNAGTCTACTQCTAAGTNATPTLNGCSGTTGPGTCSYSCNTGYAKTSTDTNGCSQCATGYGKTNTTGSLVCTACTSGTTYSNTPGTSQCTPCASPDSSTWQYTVTACTPSTGTVIATSAAGNCTPGSTYNKGYIAGTSSVTGAAGTCTACTPCTAAGTNTTPTLNGGSGTTGPGPCSYSCSTGYAKTSTDTNGCSQCAAGYGNTTAGGLTCTACTPGTNYTSAPGTGACTSCPTPTNTYDYVTAACTMTTPTAITSRATSPCTTGYLSGFTQGNSSQVGNAGTCTPCSEPNSTQYVTAICTSVSNTRFGTQTTCLNGQTLTGFTQGSSTQIGNAGSCSSSCTSGYGTTCTPCSEPNSTQYVTAICTDLLNTTFATKQTCLAGTYLSGFSQGSSTAVGNAGSCITCSDAQYCPTDGMTSPLSCPAGQSSALFDRTQCFAVNVNPTCPTGYTLGLNGQCVRTVCV